MIQLNLLPDVKLEYIKAERLKHLVVTISVLATAAALVIFLFLVLTVDIWQKKTISDLSGDITAQSKTLTHAPNLNKILTIQSQLGSLDTLHQQKYVTSRLPVFISQVTPDTATISNLTADYSQNTLVISGSAPSLDVVNTFVDGLKFTKYTVAGGSDQKAAFSNVVLSTFGRDATKASYTINLAFDPAIFSGDQDVTLVVPNIVTTRSILEQPSSVFEGGQ